MSEPFGDTVVALNRHLVLHLEDLGDHRVRFIRQILPPEKYPFEVKHINPPEESLSDEEIERRVLEVIDKERVEFIVVDLGLSVEQTAKLYEWFAQPDLPMEAPEELYGGIRLVARLIEKNLYPAEQIAFLTSHKPATLFRDLDDVTKAWFGVSIPCFRKDRPDDLTDLRKLIFEVCDYHSDEGVDEVLILFASDNLDLHKLVETAAGEHWNGWNRTFKSFAPGPGISHFEELCKVVRSEANKVRQSQQARTKGKGGKLALPYEPPFIFAVIDFTASREEDAKVSDIIDTDDYDQLDDLDGIAAIRRLNEEETRGALKGMLKIIALTDYPEERRLIRYMMRTVGVDLVAGVGEFTSELVHKMLEFFRRLKKQRSGAR